MSEIDCGGVQLRERTDRDPGILSFLLLARAATGETFETGEDESCC